MTPHTLNPEARYIQPADLGFEERDHRYVHLPTGRELRSVTTVMHDYGLGFDPFGIPESILERVSHRGSYVHAGTTLIDQDDFDDERVPEAFAGYFTAYRRFLAESGFSPRASELRLYSPTWWYAGSPDKVGFDRRLRVGLEIKTGCTDDVDVQAGGYDGLWSEWFPHALIDVWRCLKLNADGTYRVWDLDAKGGLVDFRCCLRISARRERNRRTGSEACRMKSPAHIEVPCDQCGRVFEIRRADLPKGRRHYCSKECNAARLSTERRGANHPMWRGGRYVHRGYVMLKSPSHPRADRCGYVPEHVLIAERAVGHFLPSSSPVHHANLNPGDNRNGNLVVCENQGYHRLLHHRTAIVSAGGLPRLHRICGGCRKVKLHSEFSRLAHGFLGLDSRCRACHAERRRKAAA